MKNPNITTEDYLLRVLEKHEHKIKKIKEMEKQLEKIKREEKK